MSTQSKAIQPVESRAILPTVPQRQGAIMQGVRVASSRTVLLLLCATDHEQPILRQRIEPVSATGRAGSSPGQPTSPSSCSCRCRQGGAPRPPAPTSGGPGPVRKHCP